MHAFWLSDLCTGMGNALVSGCGEERYKCQSSWLWPKTAKPLVTDWHTWQLTLTTSLHLSQDKHLVSPLGPWLLAPMHPGWYYEPNMDWLWFVADTQWTFFIPVPQHTQHRIYNVPRVCTKAPDLSNLRQASILVSASHITLTGHGLIKSPPTTIPGIHYFASLQFAIDWEVNFHIIGNWEELTQEVIQGRGYAVSDGSFKTHQEAVAWIIEGSCSSNWIIGECFAPGTDDNHSSFHSELAGIYTCLLFIYHCFQHNLQTKPLFILLAMENQCFIDFGTRG